MKKQDVKLLPVCAQNYIRYLNSVLNKSQLTVLEYASDLRAFFYYISLIKGFITEDVSITEADLTVIDNKFINSLTKDDIYSFLDYCKTEKGNSARTRARKTTSLRMFFRYLESNELITNNPVKDLRLPSVKKSLPRYLELDQCIDLLDSIDGKYFDRDYCIITLFLNCGLRLAELVALNVSDYQGDKLKVLGKGNKERIVYLNDACIKAIENYLRSDCRPHDGVKDKKALFLSRQKNRINRRRVEDIVKGFMAKAGLDTEHLSVHKLRHTAATLMYQYGGADIMVLKELLGHESIATTEIYTHVVSEKVKNAVASNPLAEVGKKD